MSSRDKPWEHHLSSCNKGKGVPRAIKVLMFSPMRVLSERWFDTCRKSSHWREPSVTAIHNFISSININSIRRTKYSLRFLKLNIIIEK